MSSEKDELISASELARRLGITPQAINNKKQKLKEAKATYGKKYYFLKSCAVLGRDDKDPVQTRQAQVQRDIAKDKKATKETHEDDNETDSKEDEAKELLEQILLAVKGGSSGADRQSIDTLKAKAGLLREYFTAKNEETKYIKERDRLFDKDEVLKIISFAMNTIRNALINLPNNYAVNLVGLTAKEIKEYVGDDINRILDELQRTGDRF